jgi:hypothetical protein
VLAAEMSTVKTAADAMGVPESSLRYWMEQPAFAEYRAKTRENLADEMKVIAHVAAHKLADAIRAGTLEPRDLITALGVAVDKAQLLSGAATERLEHRELDAFDDHETRAIVDAARKHLAGDTGREDPALAQEAAVEGAGS